MTVRQKFLWLLGHHSANEVLEDEEYQMVANLRRASMVNVYLMPTKSGDSLIISLSSHNVTSQSYTRSGWWSGSRLVTQRV
jgi:hypothetical protein